MNVPEEAELAEAVDGDYIDGGIMGQIEACRRCGLDRRHRSEDRAPDHERRRAARRADDRPKDEA